MYVLLVFYLPLLLSSLFVFDYPTSGILFTVADPFFIRVENRF